MLMPIHSISNSANNRHFWGGWFSKRAHSSRYHSRPVALNRATWQAHLETWTNRRRVLLASCVWRKMMLNILQCTVRSPEDNQRSQNATRAARNWSLLLFTYYYLQSDSANRHLKHNAFQYSSINYHYHASLLSYLKNQKTWELSK